MLKKIIIVILKLIFLPYVTYSTQGNFDLDEYFGFSANKSKKKP